MVGIGSQWCPHGAQEQVHTANDRSKHTLRADRAQVWSISLTFWSSAGPHSNLYAYYVRFVRKPGRENCARFCAPSLLSALCLPLSPRHTQTAQTSWHSPSPRSLTLTHAHRRRAAGRGARFLLGGADSCGESAWQERGGLKEMKDAKMKKQTKN